MKRDQYITYQQPLEFTGFLISLHHSRPFPTLDMAIISSLHECRTMKSVPQNFIASLFCLIAAEIKIATASLFFMHQKAYSNALPSFETAASTIFFSPRRRSDANCNASLLEVLATRTEEASSRRQVEAYSNARLFGDTAVMTTLTSSRMKGKEYYNQGYFEARIP